MLTAFYIEKLKFSISLKGVAINRDTLLRWDIQDRLEVLIDRPVETLSSGLLMLMAISAFYNGGKNCPPQPLYPDIFPIYVSGLWGLFVSSIFIWITKRFSSRTILAELSALSTISALRTARSQILCNHVYADV